MFKSSLRVAACVWSLCVGGLLARCPQHRPAWQSHASPSAAGTVCHSATSLPSASRRNACRPCFTTSPQEDAWGRSYSLNLQTEASACGSGTPLPECGSFTGSG